MTRFLLSSNDTTVQLQIPFKTNCSYDASQAMATDSRSLEAMVHESLEQMPPQPISVSLSIPTPVSRLQQQQQDSLMNHQVSNSGNDNSLSINMTNGNIGHEQSQHQNVMSSQSQTLELHSSFTSNDVLDEPEIRPHICQLCQATYKTRTHLRRHMFIHLSNRPYPCQDCGKGFNRKEHLNKHSDAVHSGTKYKCPYCGKEISRKDHLSRHIKNMHLPIGTQAQPRNNVGGGDSVGGTPRQANSTPAAGVNGKQARSRVYPNAISGLTITSLSEFLPTSSPKVVMSNGSSTNQYQGNVLSSVNVSLPSFGNSTNLNSVLDKKLLLQIFSCVDCNATFTSDRDLSIHSRVHKPQPYKCNECTRAYTRREKLTEHVRCFHQGQKFTCEYCGKELSRKDHVLRHVRSVHPEVLTTRFVAISDGTNFDSSSDQARSLNSTAQLNGNNSNNIPSMGEMGVLLRSVCHICLKVFGTSYHLCRHVESCHNGDVRPYSCNNCSKQFKRKDHLTKHMKSHCPSARDNSSSAASAALRSLINSRTPTEQPNNGTGNESAMESSALTALDAVDLMHQDAIDSLQIEMMTDADEEETEDSSSNDEDEDSKELPGLPPENIPTSSPIKDIGGGNNDKTKNESGNPKQLNAQISLGNTSNTIDFASLKSTLMDGESNREVNENAHLPPAMDTTDGDGLRMQSTFPCGHCQKEFETRSKLIQHLQEHSNNDIRINSSAKLSAVIPVTNSTSNSQQIISIPSLWSSS